MFYKGMEEATQGMIAMRAMQDEIANNLANANTTGYQEDTLLVSDFDSSLAAAMNSGQGVEAGFVPAGGGLNGDVSLLMKNVTKFEQGRLKQTHQPFDLALDGKGFFAIQTREGVHYTRNGSFSVNGEGFLVTGEGGQVLGKHGPIRIKGTSVKVLDDGTITADGKTIDKLRITWVDEKALSKVGTTDFKVENPVVWPEAVRTKVRQGYLEMSNVNAVKAMVNLLTVMRVYEASSKALETEDQMAKTAEQTSKVQ